MFTFWIFNASHTWYNGLQSSRASWKSEIEMETIQGMWGLWWHMCPSSSWSCRASWASSWAGSQCTPSEQQTQTQYNLETGVRELCFYINLAAVKIDRRAKIFLTFLFWITKTILDIPKKVVFGLWVFVEWNCKRRFIEFNL